MDMEADMEEAEDMVDIEVYIHYKGLYRAGDVV